MPESIVEVFKTSVLKSGEANRIIDTINRIYPHLKVNFDLDDCDKILRIEGNKIDVSRITQLLLNKGFQCEILH